MPTFTKSQPATLRWDPAIGLLAWVASSISVLFFLYYFKRGEAMLYGDAVAHINIARRVFDSKTPGLLQLGTVWLPLPHLLMIPFLISNDMWSRGTGGSIPSLVAYVFAVVGMFRVVRGSLTRDREPNIAARVAAWSAALIFAANPNLIYMQATAMGEAVYVALFIWSVVYFSEWLRGNARALMKCGLCLAAACLTRYDAWLLAAAMAAVVIIQSFHLRNAAPGAPLKISEGTTIKFAAIKFVLIAAAAPALWLAYNGIIYRNPLEFENGPYSAKAIEARTQNPDHPGHPGSGNPLVAGLYFVKAAGANLAENVWMQRAWLLLAAAGIVAGAFRSRKPGESSSFNASALLFLLMPVPFYALSVAYGGVPIFVPAWWPFTHYNVRYGLQLLPAAAAAIALLIYFILRTSHFNLKLRAASVLAVGALVIASYASVWRATPIVLQEAQINMRGRTHLEAQLASLFKTLPPDATLLMYLGDHVGALQWAGIPLKHVINEGNHRVWKQPVDPDGLWERALADPAAYVNYVVAFEGDPVWQAVHDRHFSELIEIHVTGQPLAILYRVR